MALRKVRVFYYPCNGLNGINTGTDGADVYINSSLIMAIVQNPEGGCIIALGGGYMPVHYVLKMSVEKAVELFQ